MCDCNSCIPIVTELNFIIDSGEEMNHLSEYMYSKTKKYYKRGRCIEIGRCPIDTEYLCEIFDTEIIGLGVRSLVNIKPETVIGCYMGCIRKSIDASWIYAFEYGLKGYVIDGSDKRSMMSYVNHSRNPNLDIDYIFHIVNGRKQIHIIFKTNQYIFAGDELYINYGDDYWKYYNSIEMKSNKKQKKITDYMVTRE
jgi:SET domain-containing protein